VGFPSSVSRLAGVEENVTVGQAAGEDSFAEFARAQFPELMRMARLLTGNEQDAEDLTQTTLTKAFVHWRAVRRANDPTAYLMRIAINCWRSSRRWRLDKSERPLDSAADRGANESFGVIDARRDLVSALTDLPARQRLAVVLRYCLDLPESEVADPHPAGDLRSDAVRVSRPISRSADALP
jgi:RNA polymerase sigma factor (sigma-70 family)